MVEPAQHLVSTSPNSLKPKFYQHSLDHVESSGNLVEHSPDKVETYSNLAEIAQVVKSAPNLVDLTVKTARANRDPPERAEPLELERR